MKKKTTELFNINGQRMDKVEMINTDTGEIVMKWYEPFRLAISPPSMRGVYWMALPTLSSETDAREFWHGAKNFPVIGTDLYLNPVEYDPATHHASTKTTP